jgi:RNA-directed DNA polymerase
MRRKANHHPWWMCFLGISFTSKRGDTRVRIHSKSIKRFKEKVRKLTGRNTGRSIHQIIYDLNLYLRGWWNYYSITQSNSIFRSINGWIMRRLRAILWKQWKNPRTRVRQLMKRGISSCISPGLLPRSAEPPWYAIRMPGGVGGTVSDGCSYPDS